MKLTIYVQPKTNKVWATEKELQEYYFNQVYDVIENKTFPQVIERLGNTFSFGDLCEVILGNNYETKNNFLNSAFGIESDIEIESYDKWKSENIKKTEVEVPLDEVVSEIYSNFLK